MRARVLLLALAVAVLGAGPARAASVPTVPKGWIGMLADDPVFAPGVNVLKQFKDMRRAGVQTVRIPFYGAKVQPSPSGTIDLSGEDRIMLAAARAKLRVLPVLLSVPSWARTTPTQPFSGPNAKGLSWYADWCTALVRRYGPYGTLWKEHPDQRSSPVRKWQLWNEPEGVTFWYESTRSADYVRLLQTASPAIHAADPSAKVVLGGIVAGGDPLRFLYQQNTRDLFDEVAIHPFTYQVSNVVRLIREARGLMRSYGDARKPLELTEVAWPTAYKRVPKAVSFGFEVTRREQAQRVRSIYRRLARDRKRYGIAGVYWASWLSRDNGTYSFNYAGLRRLGPRGGITNKPGYYAFRKVARELARR